MNQLPENFDAHVRAAALADRYPGIVSLCADLILELAAEGDARAQELLHLAAGDALKSLLTTMLVNIPAIDRDPELLAEVLRQANRYNYGRPAWEVLDQLSEEPGT